MSRDQRAKIAIGYLPGELLQALDAPGKCSRYEQGHCAGQQQDQHRRSPHAASECAELSIHVRKGYSEQQNRRLRTGVFGWCRACGVVQPILLVNQAVAYRTALAMR